MDLVDVSSSDLLKQMFLMKLDLLLEKAMTLIMHQNTTSWL